MTTRDNAAPPPEWTPPVGRHCGEFCWDITCPLCGEYVVPSNIELGQE